MSLIKYNRFPCLFCVCVCVIISANLALEFVISFFRVIVAVVISGRCSFSSLSNLLILNPGIWIITTCAQHKNLNKIWWQNIHGIFCEKNIVHHIILFHYNDTKTSFPEFISIFFPEFILVYLFIYIIERVHRRSRLLCLTIACKVKSNSNKIQFGKWNCKLS